MPEFLLKSYSEILNNFRITGKLQKLLFKLSSKIDLTFFRAYFNTEAVVQSCSVEKVILEISQNSQENTCAKVSFLTELQASGLHVNTICRPLHDACVIFGNHVPVFVSAFQYTCVLFIQQVFCREIRIFNFSFNHNQNLFELGQNLLNLCFNSFMMEVLIKQKPVDWFLYGKDLRHERVKPVTAKNTAISPDFLVWEFCGKAQFPHSFRRFAQNYAETVPFRKISTPGNQVKLRYFSQCVLIRASFLLAFPP